MGKKWFIGETRLGEILTLIKNKLDLKANSSDVADNYLSRSGGTVNGKVDFNDDVTVNDSLSVSGTSRCKDLKVTDSAEIGGTLNVSGQSTFSGTVNYTGNQNVNGSLDVSGTARFRNDTKTKKIEPIDDNTYNIGKSNARYKKGFIEILITLAGSIKGEDNDTYTNHDLQIGHGGKDYWDFFEYGGLFRFWRSQNGVNTLLGSINANGWDGNWKGYNIDFNTANNSDTWVPVLSGNTFYHRSIPAAYNNDPGTLYVNYANSAGSASNASYANNLRRTNDNTAMDFGWYGQSGQPNWVWGSNDGVHNYVWSPSNFRVAYANVAGNLKNCSSVEISSSVRSHQVGSYVGLMFGTNSSQPRISPRTYGSPEYNSDGTLYCSNLEASNGNVDLGYAGQRFRQLYATNSTISTSDRRYKKEISYTGGEDAGYESTYWTDEDITNFIESLRPVVYKFKDGTSDRPHHGLIAQDIEEILLKMDKDHAGFIKSPIPVTVKKEVLNEETGEIKIEEESIIPDHPDYEYSLRYEEFIADVIRYVQILEKRVNELEKRLADTEALEKRVAALEAKLSGEVKA